MLLRMLVFFTGVFSQYKLQSFMAKKNWLVTNSKNNSIFHFLVSRFSQTFLRVSGASVEDARVEEEEGEGRGGPKLLSSKEQAKVPFQGDRQVGAARLDLT